MMSTIRPLATSVALAMLLAGTAMMAQAQDNTKTPEDFVITARIETMFLLNGDLNPFKINTTTKAGVVTMTGMVHEKADKDLAGRLAKSMKGVKSVENNLTVDRAAEIVEENKVFRAQVDDANLNARIHRRLAYNASLKDTMVEIDVNGSKVTVTGKVESDAKKAEIERIIDDTAGVATLDSKLVVEKPATAVAPSTTASDAVQTVSDEWVEKMVETSIMWDDNLSIKNIDVEVENGVCILSGTVISQAQKDLAATIAKGTDGVKSVSNKITVS